MDNMNIMVYQFLVLEQEIEFRLPAYHRLDISAKYIPKPDKIKRWKAIGFLVFIMFIIRRNAASISFRENRNTGDNEALRLSIFGIIPSISYNFKF